MKTILASLVANLAALVSVSAEWIEPPAETSSGYPVPAPGYTPDLPRDHGAHPAYGIEWWYWVGHLEAVASGHSYGFQSTVFRVRGSAAEPVSGNDAPVFGDQQLFMAHVALSDLNSGKYQHAERVYREGWQARASTETLDLTVGPIAARWQPDSKTIGKTVALPDGSELKLRLAPAKPMVVFGKRGLSRKGSDPAAVSWYWTYPRLEVSGHLDRGDGRIDLRGVAWMDHEVSSSQLGSDLEGWDWTAIQLDDGTEVKAYRLRRADGSADRWSAVYWIDGAGNTEVTYAEGFTWEAERHWKSDQTGIAYPIAVTIRATHPASGEEKVYRLLPRMDAQEFTGNRANNAYWEGACHVLDASGNRIGRAYLELAGYGGGLTGQLTQ